MLVLIAKESEEFRTVRFEATEQDEPLEVPFTYVHLMPIEVQRIREGTLDEVQKILRKYI